MELFVVQGPDQGRSFALSAQSVVGRDSTAVVHLTDEEVSRRHALITLGEGQILVEDLGSSNGTYVDDVLVEGEVDLLPGAKLQVGQSVLELRVLKGAEDPEELKATKTSLRPPSSAA